MHPFKIPHDAQEPVGYAFSCKGLKCAVATDIGHIREEWMEAVSGSQAVVLEANHDVETLRSGPYPYDLKKRILGAEGHLCNEDAARFAVELAQSGTSELILAHLSQENNTPAMAKNAVERAMNAAGLSPVFSVAPRNELSCTHVTQEAVCRK